MKCKCGDSMIHAGRLDNPPREFLQCCGATERQPFSKEYNCPDRWQLEVLLDGSKKGYWRSRIKW